MNRFVCLSLFLPLAFTSSLLAVTITKPANNAQVASPVSLVASADSCSDEPVTAMGYSLDSSTDTTLVDKRGIGASIPAAAGKHTIHVKAWNTKGAVCLQDVAVNVTSAQTSPEPPANASSTSAAGITVTSPASGATVSSPFTLTASASGCQSKAITKTGYSLDNSSSTTMVDSSTIGATVSAGTGSHTVHVKAWGTGGVVCSEAVKITVSGSSESGTGESGTGESGTGTAATGATSTPSTDGITVSSPENGSSVSTSFGLVASAPTCSGQPVSSLGYSLDNSSNTTIVNGTSVNTQVVSPSGGHTLHVKAWGKSGASCTMQNVSITVAAAAVAGDSVPSDATVVSNLQTLSTWKADHDTGMNGNASGSTTVVTSPTLSSHARKFSTSWSSNGGERYSLAFGDDRTSTNFMYDGWVYIASSSGVVANIEMDLNQTMANGNTLILGFQCDGYKGKWDYSVNTGTAAKPSGTWASSSQTCNPANWSRDTWHHVQILFSRGASDGTVTYKSVTLDGTTQAINATASAARRLGWGSSIVTNFQVDGRGAGSATVYLDKLTVSRW